jgi:folate-binding protein YgfZ
MRQIEGALFFSGGHGGRGGLKKGSEVIRVTLATQIEAARRAVLVVPAPEWVSYVVTGQDRLSWLNGLLTCDLASRKPGDAVYGLAVALKGRIVSDVVVAIDAERVILLVERAAAEALGESLDRYLMMEDAEVTRAFDRFGVFFAHGTGAGALLDAARSAGAVGGELDRTGLGGAVILAEGDAREPVRMAIASAVGRLKGAWGDDAGWEALRLERGVPRFGIDFDGTTYPQEASLEKVAVSFSKGCYLGQEVVCMLEMRGHVKRKLMPLVLEGDGVPERGARVLDGAGADVGSMTSAALSPTLAHPVGLAMVKFAVAEAGKELYVGATKGRLVERPA